jgi:DNA-3-methyladenine glycosylase
MKPPKGMITPEQSFFAHDTKEVARGLLGHWLYVDKHGQPLAGRIVETEAYLYRNDPACHAAKGITERNRSMFRAGGIAYVYLIYGMHHCLNIVAGPEGEGTAVLIRAMEPLVGTDLMRTRRPKAKRLEDIANGPGKLTIALGLTREDDGTDLLTGHIRLFLDPEMVEKRPRMVTSTRIGINQGTDRKLRYYIHGHPCVSVKS